MSAHSTNADDTRPARPRGKRKRIPPLSISFNKGEEEHREEFFRQLRRYAKENRLEEEPNQSDFAKHLLYQVLYPDDRPDTPTIQVLLEDLKGATEEIRTRLRTLEEQNKKLGNTLAEGVGMVLVHTRALTQEQVKEWLEKRLGAKSRDNNGPAW